MNIALFSDTYTPDLNGVAVSTRILRDELVNKGHNVTVVTTELPSNSTYLDKPTDNILRVPGLELQALYGYRAANIYSFKGMKELKELNIDLIHVQTEFGIGIFGRIVSEFLNIPIIYTYHTMWSDYTHYLNPIKLPMINKVFKMAIEGISRLYSDKCTELIVPSKKTLDALKKYGLKRQDSHIIPTGLQLSKFDPKNSDLDQVKKIKEDYNLNGKFVITFLGRIAEEKSIDVVIKAIKKVVPSYPSLMFMIVGGGPQLEQLKSLVNDLDINTNVIFTGPKPPEVVPFYYHASNIFISASLSETQGLTYIEAMASGLPVIARFDEQLADVIEDKVTGFFFKSDIELVDLIEKVISMDLDELSNSAYLKAQSYGASVFADRVIEVYQQAINHKHYTYVVRSIIPLKNKLNEVTFAQDDHNIILELSDRVINTYNIVVNKKYERDDFENIRNLEQTHNAYNKALKLLAIKDYSYNQMKDSLTKSQVYTSKQVEDALILLVDKNLINDEELALNYLKTSPAKGIGLKKAIYNLKSKYKIDSKVIDLCLEIINSTDEYDGAVSLIERYEQRYQNISHNSRINKLKVLLFNHGFQKEIINKVIEDYNFEYNEEVELIALKKDYDKLLKKYCNKYEKSDLKSKIITNLLRKGYTYDNILSVVELKEDFE